MKSPHLPTVIEVPVRDGLLGCQLPQLIEENVELELGLKVRETPVTETLQRAVSYHGAHVLHVRHEGLQVGDVVVNWRINEEIILSLVDMENSFDNFGSVAAILQRLRLPGVVLCPRGMDWMI